VMAAANVDPAVFNRTLHDGSRYNVYAIDKFADAVRAHTAGIVLNRINRACMLRSLFKFWVAVVAFTGEMAKCAALDKIRVDARVKELLIRHAVASVPQKNFGSNG
jgi:hypothetical protein